MPKHDPIAALAQRTAKRLSKRRSNHGLLSEQEQIKQYQARLQQGFEGFKDVVDAHGMNGLRRYQNAMNALARRLGVRLGEGA